MSINHNRKAGALASATDCDSSSVYSAVSVTSSYRHHYAGPFMQTSSESQPKPVLSKDLNHTPKTTGSLGILVVGLGGANGCTLTAGILANRLRLEWYGPRGECMRSNWYGCITQLKQKGGGVGYKDKVRGLADASLAAVGGWVRACVLTLSCVWN
jgi:Myo-inositol-1-phosphate synthase